MQVIIKNTFYYNQKKLQINYPQELRWLSYIEYYIIGVKAMWTSALFLLDR